MTGGVGNPGATGSATPTTTGSNILGGGFLGNTRPADSAAKPANSSCEYGVTTKRDLILMNLSLRRSYNNVGVLYRPGRSR